jgi:hypothetical protein
MNKCIDCGKEIDKRFKRCWSCNLVAKTKYPRDKQFYYDNYVKTNITLEEFAVKLGNPNLAKCGKLKRIIESFGFEVRKRDQWGDKNNTWIGGRIKDGNGYILLKKPGYPKSNSRGYVREHVYVWEQANHASVPKGWHVHHINGIRDDNRIENLQAMPASEHIAMNLLDWNKTIANYKETIKQLREENKMLKKELKI